MATVILAAGIAAANSAAVTLAAGETAVIFLSSPSGAVPEGVRVGVDVQTAAAGWTRLDELKAPARSLVTIPGPCTFRVARPDIPAQWGVTVGVDRG